MNDQLKTIFANTNDWLKFAEAKNAGMLALDIACIVGILRGDAAFKDPIKPFEGVMLALLCISSCLCIYTILPVLNKWFRFYKKLSNEEFKEKQNYINVFYFGDISTLSKEQYKEVFQNKSTASTLSAVDDDLIFQITINAEICFQKYKIFNISAILTLGTIVVGFLSILYLACSK